MARLAISQIMPLSAGTRLGHYDVTALLGEGGMGQVWQATDTQLGRQVALKILPDAFAADPDRLARFTREAQILASLNHPNIAQIHGIEEAEGTRALVLELVEGPTLADRIAQGAIPIEDALPIAKQIAEALEAAHEAGVIHRDLKPANIKVREDGIVKVLDFGLAKALNPNPEGDPSQSPTLTAATQMGVIMGTAAYMSPEQARGKPVDRRTDIWAFGCVLYEMLTRKRAFGGEDVSLTLSAVLQREPEWDALPTSTSGPLRRLLHRCLDKDARERLRDIGEARIGMREVSATPLTTPGIAEPVRPHPAWGQMTPWIAGVTLGGVIVGLAGWNLGSPGPPVAPTKRFSITLPMSAPMGRFGTPGGFLALSPDGSVLVYRGPDQLYRRDMNQLSVTPIRDTEGAIGPTFSPDGRWLAFYAGIGGPLKRVSLAGGSALTIVEDPLAQRGHGPQRGAQMTPSCSPLVAQGLLAHLPMAGFLNRLPCLSQRTRLTVPPTSCQMAMDSSLTSEPVRRHASLCIRSKRERCVCSLRRGCSRITRWGMSCFCGTTRSGPSRLTWSD